MRGCRKTLNYLFCFLMSCWLTNCAHHPINSNAATEPVKNSKRYTTAKAERDGAPTGLIPAFLKAVTPKYESLSRYGNPQTYAVNGRTYAVMTSTRGYKSRGIASWYGTKFHSKRTSSGDHYNMYAMTAAHRTLPLPTYVRVKNLTNGRAVVVKVNDRGPFHSNRIIDLSYAAASKLGMLPRGTAPVEVEALDLGKRIAKYYIQAGAFNSKNLAYGLQNKITKLTSSPVVVEQYAQRFVVKLGPFANRQLTDSLKNKLLANGIRGAFALLL